MPLEGTGGCFVVCGAVSHRNVSLAEKTEEEVGETTLRAVALEKGLVEGRLEHRGDGR